MPQTVEYYRHNVSTQLRQGGATKAPARSAAKSQALKTDDEAPTPPKGPTRLALAPGLQPAHSAPTPLSVATQPADYFVDCSTTTAAAVTADGSKRDPWGSLPHARDALRGLRAQGGEEVGDATLLVEVSGSCHLGRPMTLNASDSFTIFRGSGRDSLISSGKALRWLGPSHRSQPGANTTPPSAPAPLQADVSAWPRTIKSLRVGLERRERSRYPPRTVVRGRPSYRDGWLFAQNLPPGIADNTTADCIWCAKTLCNASRPATPYCWLALDPSKIPPPVLAGVRAQNASWLNVFGTGEADVLNMILPIVDVHVSGSAVKVPILPYDGRGGFHLYQRLWLENVPPTTGSPLPPAEFFVDERTKRLSYMPMDAAERAALTAAVAPGGGRRAPLQAVAPVSDVLLDLNGTTDIVFSNVSFRDTSYYAVGSWYGPAAEPSDGAVRINHANHVSFEACSFLPGLSGYGVVVGNRSHDIKVVGSLFTGLGEGGVLMYGVQDRTANGANWPPSHNLVSHCVFHDLGKTLIHVAAVSFRASSGNVVSHNRISSMPRYALEADSFYNLSRAGGRISRDNVSSHV